MAKLNWEIVKWNVIEAREELQRIEEQITKAEISEGIFEVSLAHAFHHLNYAWNIRRISSKRYGKCSEADFNAWGAFPSDLELMKID